MRGKRAVVVGAAFALLAFPMAGGASADIELPDYPNAEESTCQATLDRSATKASCKITSIGTVLAVAARGQGGAFVATLERPSEIPGGPPTIIATCDGLGMCVSSAYYMENPYPGESLICRARGIGPGNFECSSFNIE